jgi:hypothetical protein
MRLGAILQSAADQVPLSVAALLCRDQGAERVAAPLMEVIGARTAVERRSFGAQASQGLSKLIHCCVKVTTCDPRIR